MPDEPEDVLRTRRAQQVLRWLRHGGGEAGITLDNSGWASIPSVCDALSNLGEVVSPLEVKGYALRDSRRFELEGDRLRARYGHSVPLSEGLSESIPPATLYAGVPPRYAERTLAVGLAPQKRSLLSLSIGRAEARQQASRRGEIGTVLLIDAHGAHKAGVKFYPRGKGVWLAETIPSQFLSIEPGPTPGSRPGSSGKEVRRSRNIGILKRPPKQVREANSRDSQSS